MSRKSGSGGDKKIPQYQKENSTAEYIIVALRLKKLAY